MLLISAIILTIVYYTILMIVDIKSRGALRLAEASKNAIGETSITSPESKAISTVTAVTENSGSANLFGVQQGHDTARKEKEKPSPSGDNVEGKNEPDKKTEGEAENSGTKEVTPSPEEETDATNPTEKNDGQTDEEKRKDLFAGTGIANEKSGEVAEPDDETAGALEELAGEYMARVDIRPKSQASTGEDAEE